MPASKQLDLTALTATVTRATGVMASAKALILGQGAATIEAVRAALEADNVTDDNFVQVAIDAIKSVDDQLVAGVDDLAAGLVTNPGPGGPPTPESLRR